MFPFVRYEFTIYLKGETLSFINLVDSFSKFYEPGTTAIKLTLQKEGQLAQMGTLSQ